MILFSISIFLSAFLLFCIQPLFGKMILPYLGGSPSVWNTCMVFYQALLLLGYIYAHFAIKILGIKKQSAFHIILALVIFIFLPIHIPSSWNPQVINNPIPSLLKLMLLTIGPPFFLLSASSPMLQRWFSSTNHPHAKDPYFLYVASNWGSMIALFTYPFLIEPTIKLSMQSNYWLYLYLIFFIFLVLCRQTIVKQLTNNEITSQDSSKKISNKEKLKWVTYSFIPSSLMLGVTNYISIDISPIPLFWVIPLGIYLFTFILTFSNNKISTSQVMVKIMPFTVSFLLFFTICLHENYSIWVGFLLHLLVFFIISMVFHGELSRNRPDEKYLTEFYIWLSTGGFLGGIFNALISPILFKEVIEYPLIIILSCTLIPIVSREKLTLKKAIVSLTPGIGIFLIYTILKDINLYHPQINDKYFIYGVALLFAIKQITNPIRFGLCIGSILLAFTIITGISSKNKLLFQERNFFGIHRVSIDNQNKFINLYQDTTLHGTQKIKQRNGCNPLSYYHVSSPIGQLFYAFYNDKSKKKIAAIGLGTGSLACYGAEDQEWTFFEIDPTIVAINHSGKLFTYLVNSSPDTTIIFGDARLSLKKMKNEKFDFIILDAFSSDAIPVHLLTSEALDLYLSRLSTNGIIAFHTSNRHLDLPKVISGLIYHKNLSGIIQQHYEIREEGATSSEWILVARKKEDFKKLNESYRWHLLGQPSDIPIWTDDYSNIFSIIKDFKF